MVARVVADLKPIGVQFGDLFPGHVVFFIGGEVKPLGDEERRPKAVSFEDRPDDRMVRLHGVVKREDHELIGDRFERRGRQREREHEERLKHRASSSRDKGGWWQGPSARRTHPWTWGIR